MNTIQAAKTYWKIRDSGVMGEQRTIAHNRLMDALAAVGITHHDRVEAAQIGAELANVTTLTNVLHYAVNNDNLLADAWLQMAVYALSVGQRLSVEDFLETEVQLPTRPYFANGESDQLLKHSQVQVK